MISVIVPTYNSEETIQRLLDKLIDDLVNVKYEVIIVDGCSSDRTMEICKRYPVIIKNNPKVHAAAARNIGIQTSKGDICAFIDSDCVPCKRWVDLIEKELSAKDVDAIGGRMIAYPPRNDIEDFAGHIFLDTIMKFPDERKIVSGKHLENAFITANCAYRKELLLAIGGFDEFFTNNGEDLDLYWRAIEASSAKLVYVPELVVEHSFPDTLKKLRLKYRQYGIADSKLKSRFSKKKVTVDFSHYRRFAVKLLTLAFHPRTNFFYLVYIWGHICGKISGSFKYHVINL